ncbi:hypothetical protein GO988_21535 [Hymenobacter sp. HMF4947]|uniref:Uncharacterized protein n=1 Tax=Hymenobacter ginkgonis TaxID=2682976 RepID=A0A7K1TKH9_9BACT|nr:hypothetical protein [Hymenobacter ginkgonis]MVN78920.1 hypothetical protein [Hymenobacter ginkgonis]
MKASPTVPNAARGEVTLTIAGAQHTIRFGMNVMRDFSKLTGRAPSEFGEVLGDDYTEALTGIVSCAITRYVPAEDLPNGFDQDAAADFIDALSREDADALAEAITEAVTVPPLMTSLMAKVKVKNQAAAGEALATNGTATSASHSVS